MGLEVRYLFHFCFTGLSRSHISDSELVKLTQIDSDFFFLDVFFMKLIFVYFIFSHQIIGTWALWFFLLFFLWGYPECRLVQWTSVNSIFFSAFFYLTSVFFARLFFFKSSFFLSLSHIMGDKLIELTRVDTSFFLSLSHIMGDKLIELIRVDTSFFLCYFKIKGFYF